MRDGRFESLRLELLQGGVNPDARNDFNGDGRSDILWRDSSGAVTNSLGQANGGFASNAANFIFAKSYS